MRATALLALLVVAISAGAQRVEKQLFDFVVPDDGDFSAAIEAANKRADTTERFRIFLRRGDYVIPASQSATVMGLDSVAYPDPRTDLRASRVSIVGEGQDITSVRNTCPANTVAGQWGPACPIEGLQKAYTLRNGGVDNYFQGFRLVNGMADATGRGEAFEDCGDRTICKEMALWGYQDTYFSNRDGALHYFEGGVIRGRTDYVCGKGDVVFNGVEFRHCAPKGYIAAPSRAAKYGYVMLDCSVTGERDGIDGTYTLGRPWNDTPTVLWINTTCHVRPSDAGWGEMSSYRYPVRMAEYGTRDGQGNLLDLSRRKREWKDREGNVKLNNPVLTQEEAAAVTIDSVLGRDGWNPEALCNDAPEPANVRIAGNRVVWDDCDEVLCWAVCKDGRVWRFTTEPSVEIDDRSCAYSVRAVNEMGGLGRAVAAAYWNEAAYRDIERRIVVPTFKDKDYPITSFGASVNADARRNQRAIGKAIAACSKHGGGRVVVPAGVWHTGAVTLLSNVNLVVERGATLQFVFDRDLYPNVPTRWEGQDCWNYQPCIYACNQRNVAITGEGTIDGGATWDDWWLMCGKSRAGSGIDGECQNNPDGRLALMKMAEDGVDRDRRIFGKGKGLRPQLVNLNSCENILIEGVTMLRSPFWVIHPLLSKNITVRNVKVWNEGPNGDGCDPESCEDVLIEHCTFHTGDDCIAIKSGRNADGRLWSRPSCNIIVRDCDFENGHGGVVIGSEISGGFRNLFVENCRMDSPNLDRVLRIKTNTCRGGVVENVYFRNVAVGQCREAVLKINLDYEPREACCRDYPPTVRNVFMENVTCNKSKYGVMVVGLPDRCNVSGVNLRNCRFDGVTDRPVHVTGRTRDFCYDNLTINGEAVLAELPFRHYSEWLAHSEMKRVPQACMLDFSTKPKWSYVMGIELEGMLDTYLAYRRNPRNEAIVDYLHGYAREMIGERGGIRGYHLADYNLDNIRTGKFILRMEQLFPEQKNRMACDTLWTQLLRQPRTAQGVWFHKAIYANQVWLDGIFMGLPFYTYYINTYLDPTDKANHAKPQRVKVQRLYDDVVSQVLATDRFTYDEKTRLWKHAWDETRSIFWADKRTGLSRHTWARALGWYAMAIVEILDVLPESHPRRGELVALLGKVLVNTVERQDGDTGLWYDVMDVDDPRNYLEATASSMFAYCLLKSARLGYVGDDMRQAGVKAYRGIVRRFIKVNPDATISLTGCCAVSGLGPESNRRRDGSFEYYMSEPVRDNDAKGVGPFIWASLEMERMGYDIEKIGAGL